VAEAACCNTSKQGFPRTGGKQNSVLVSCRGGSRFSGLAQAVICIKAGWQKQSLQHGVYT